MVRCLGILALVVSCAFPAPPPSTVVNRAPFVAQPGLDRPLLVAVPVTGYELARFGFGVAIDKRYDASKTLGHYLWAYDWTTGAFAGRTFWDGRGASNGRDVVSEASGPRYLLGARGWAGLDPVSGAFTTGTFPPDFEPSRHVSAGQWVVLGSHAGIGRQPTTLRTYSLTTGQVVGSAVTIPLDRDAGEVQMRDDRLDATGRFWIDTGRDEIYRYHPLTQELLLVHSEPLGSAYHTALLGASGSSFLVSRYRVGVSASDPTDAQVLVFDAATPPGSQTFTVAVPPGSWISLGLEVQGLFYLLVNLHWDANTQPVKQIWTFDPATGAAAFTNLSFSLWSGDLAARDNTLLLFSTMTKAHTLSVGKADFTTKTVTYSEQSLTLAVQP